MFWAQKEGDPAVTARKGSIGMRAGPALVESNSKCDEKPLEVSVGKSCESDFPI